MNRLVKTIGNNKRKITGVKTVRPGKKLKGSILVLALVAGIAIGGTSTTVARNVTDKNNSIVLEELPEDELNDVLDSLGISQESYDEFIELGKEINFTSNDEKEDLESYAQELYNLSLSILKEKIAKAYNVSSEDIKVDSFFDGAETSYYYILIGDEQIKVKNSIFSQIVSNITSLNYEIARTEEREDKSGTPAEEFYEQSAIQKRYETFEKLLLNYDFYLDEKGNLKSQKLDENSLDELLSQGLSNEEYGVTFTEVADDDGFEH